MSPLAYVWISAVGLACFSLATMISLIGARLVHTYSRARRAKRRALVLPELIHHIGGLTDTVNLAGLERDAVLMAEVVRDLASLVKGPERTRLMHALTALGVDERLRELLRKGGANKRVLAAEALVFFPCVETYAVLLKASRTAQMRVRLPALRTLIDLERAPPLGQLLDSVASGSQRASLLFSELLQRAARSQIDAAIAAYAREDLSPAARISVIQALGSTDDGLALAPLCDAAASPDAEIRTAAFAALAALGHPMPEPVVAAGLADPDWRVRLKAIECVRRLGLTAFAPAVMACAEDEVWWVRYRAGQTVASLAEQEVARLRDFVGGPAGQPQPSVSAPERAPVARAAP